MELFIKLSAEELQVVKNALYGHSMYITKQLESRKGLPPTEVDTIMYEERKAAEKLHKELSVTA